MYICSLVSHDKALGLAFSYASDDSFNFFLPIFCAFFLAYLIVMLYVALITIE